MEAKKKEGRNDQSREGKGQEEAMKPAGKSNKWRCEQRQRSRRQWL